MTDSSVPPIHDALVARLRADAAPVRHLWPPWARLAMWLVVAAAVAVIAAVAGLRSDLPDQLRRLRYDVEVSALLAAAALAALAALWAAIPGRDGARGAAVVAGVLGATALAIGLLQPSAVAEPPAAFVVHGLRCTLCVALFGALPWGVLFVAVRRGAPLDGRATAGYVGAAAFLVGAAAVRIACPIDDPAHLLAWHAVPVAAWTVLSATTAATWLLRWHHADARR